MSAVAARTLSSRDRPRGTEPLECLLDEAARPGGAARGPFGAARGPFPAVSGPFGEVRGGLTPELALRYAGDLSIPLRADRPTVVANFVETIDGLVAFDRRGVTGGGDVSGFSPTDRFVMGLLRALADVVLVGGATLRSSPRSSWTPAAIHPPAGPDYGELRRRLGLGPAPWMLVATASGELDPAHPALARPDGRVVIAGPDGALRRLRERGIGRGVALERLDGAGAGAMPELVALAGRMGARLVLSEAGPHLFGALLEAALVDELFLTIAPQIAGHGSGDRLALAEGVALWPGDARWSHLVSVRRAGDHVFLRYRREESDR